MWTIVYSVIVILTSEDDLRVFKTKWFARYARRERIADESLCEAIERAGREIIDADFGGELIKQRIAKEGQGRSKGHRVLIAYRQHNRSVFLYGFAKNERDNIDDDELASLKDIAAAWLNANDQKIKCSLDDGSLQEVKYDKKV